MSRQAAGNEEDGIDTDRVTGPFEAWREAFGGRRDPAQAPGVERHRRGVLAGTLLYFDEREGAAAPRDQIDLAARDPGTAREDPPAVEAQPPGGDGLGAASALLGDPAFQRAAPSSSARAFWRRNSLAC